MSARGRPLGALAILASAIVAMSAWGAAGRTSTAFGVTPQGESTYSIPIFAPPGTHGMTPQLAFTYGHRTGSAVSGQGWAIAGLSTITRCPKTWAQDGQARGVKLDAYDRFCLDGNQLKLDSGTYGANGAVYRTEIETYARVTSNLAAGTGPESFVVYRKDGLIYDYGTRADSRIESVGSASVRVWALTTIRDRNNNRIEFNYTEDTTLGSYRLNSVDYTSNPSLGLSANYHITFNYTGQPSGEVDSEYFAGGKVKDITRLTDIVVTYGTTVVRKYLVNYESSLSSASHSRVNFVRECADAAAADCLPATQFAYQDGLPGLSAHAATGVSTGGTVLAIDVNGDGKTDLAYSSNATPGTGTWMVAFANGSGGYSAPVNTTISNAGSDKAIPIDYNADGLEDILVPYSGGVWYVLQGTTSGLAAPVSTGIARVTGSGAAAYDFNGDGLDDLIETTTNAVQYRARVWGGTFAAAQYILGPLTNALYVTTDFYLTNIPSRRRFPDFDGDGRRDVVVTVVELDQNGQPYPYDEIVLASGAIWSIGTGQFAVRVIGDFNGDGYSDIADVSSGSLQWELRYSTGASLGPWIAGPSTSGQSLPGSLAFDWDGDGYDDLLVPGTDGIWRRIRSTGEAFETLPVSTGVASGSGVSRAFAGDINGDGLDDPIAVLGSGAVMMSLHTGPAPDLLATATDGFGNVVNFLYTSIAQSNYTKAADGVYPHVDFQQPLVVASQYTASDGLGSTYTTSFWYYNARVNVQGRGFEGFYAFKPFDSRTGINDLSYFLRDFPYTGMPFEHDLYQPSGGAMFESNLAVTPTAHEFSSSYEKRYFPYVQYGYQRQWEVGGPNNGADLRMIEHYNYVDHDTGTSTDVREIFTEKATGNGLYGNATWTRQTVVPTPASNLYSDWTTWCIGRPSQVQQVQSHSLTYGTQQTRTVSTNWNGTYCRPTQNQLQPGDAQWQVTTGIGYDSWGNVNSETVTGIGMTARTTTVNWGATGQFPTTITNAASEVTQRTWKLEYGTPATMTDPNGAVTTYAYDGFGRLTSTTNADTTILQTSYLSCDSSNGYCGVPDLRYYTLSVLYTSGLSAEIQRRYHFTDSRGRERYDEWRALDGSLAYQIAFYDALGRQTSKGTPTTGTPFYTTTTYDLLNRPLTITHPKSESDSTPVVTTLSYRGLTTLETDGLGKQRTTIVDAPGEVVRSADHYGYYQQFSFDAFGNAKEVKDSNNTTLQSATFNIRGLRTASTDVDMGSWGYGYNALGEMTSHTDANGQTTSYLYDALSRMTTRTEPNAGGTLTKTWLWGNTLADHNIGQLRQALISGTGITTYAENYYYDGLGRPNRVIYYDGANYFQFDSTYNSSTGLLESIQYPTYTDGTRHQVVYEYQYGYPKKVRDVGNTVTYWLANSQDARGNVIDETLGNGLKTTRAFDAVTGLPSYIRTGPGGGTARQNLNYTWDAVGNLFTRNDANQTLTEMFYYDNVHRLDHSTLNGATNLQLYYNTNGNINSKSDLGSYTYHATKIHAVSLAGGWSYGYDANGNVTSKNGAAITWFASNLPKSISNGTYNSQFEYGAGGNYWKQTATYGTGTETTRYFSGLLEIVQGAVTSWRHQIRVNGVTVAIYNRGSNGVNVTQYLLRDHLGSVDVVTDSAGAVFVKESFAAYGARRGTNWTGTPSGADMANIGNATRRGYTDHTMLDNLGLVHMNGRVLDPALGRFMSADPAIDCLKNTQGWNRYSYVKNNPLTLIDPSGFTASALQEITVPGQREPRRDDDDSSGGSAGSRVPFMPPGTVGSALPPTPRDFIPDGPLEEVLVPGRRDLTPQPFSVAGIAALVPYPAEVFKSICMANCMAQMDRRINRDATAVQFAVTSYVATNGNERAAVAGLIVGATIGNSISAYHPDASSIVRTFANAYGSALRNAWIGGNPAGPIFAGSLAAAGAALGVSPDRAATGAAAIAGAAFPGANSSVGGRVLGGLRGGAAAYAGQRARDWAQDYFTAGAVATCQAKCDK